MIIKKYNENSALKFQMVACNLSKDFSVEARTFNWYSCVHLNMFEFNS